MKGNIMKQFHRRYFCMVLLCLIIGCSSGEEGKTQKVTAPEAPVVAKKRIALIMKTLTNPFFIEMENGARKAEKELGIQLIVKTGAKETSIEQQIAIVDEMIQEKVDAIVIAPGSSTELVPSLKKAQDAGIPIVNIDNKLDEELSRKLDLKDVPFISVDNEKGAYLSAKYISDKILKPTKVLVLEGIREAENAKQRKNGALRAFRENRNIQVIAMDSANWKIDEAYDVTAKHFGRHPDIGAIFCSNDMMALGAIHYLEKQGKKGILIAAFDALEEARNAIRAGMMEVTINQRADQQGYLGVKYALDMIQGKKPQATTLIEVSVVSKENAR
jgi:ribose transport system substrate-binding protein